MKSGFYKADNISIFLDMKLADMISVAESAFACGVASGVYGKKTESGTCTPNPAYAYIGRRIAGGLPATLPTEGDFMDPYTGPLLVTYPL